MIPLPTPTVEYHFNWDAPDYGPACLTYGAESLRAHASYIEVSFLPGETEPRISVQGYVVTQAGKRDRRFSYPQHCRPDSVDDAVWEAVGEVVNK